MSKFRLLPLVAVCLFAATYGAAAFAQRQLLATVLSGRPEVKVNLTGSVERESKAVPVEEVGAVISGEVLHWVITSNNEGTAAARSYQAVGQIPLGTLYVENSAKVEGMAAIRYSIDNGQAFSTEPMIEKKQADGSIKRINAPVSMYTQIRYEWNDPLAAGSHVSASYEVKVK